MNPPAERSRGFDLEPMRGRCAPEHRLRLSIGSTGEMPPRE